MNFINKSILVVLGLIGLLFTFYITFGIFYIIEQNKKTSQNTFVNYELTPQEEQKITELGIDFSKLESVSPTPEIEKCFAEKLGTKRLTELAFDQGLATWEDLQKLMECLE